MFMTILAMDFVGIKAQNDMLGLRPLSGTAELSEEKQVVTRISHWETYKWGTNGMWFEERLLLGYDKDILSTYSSNLDNPPRSSNNRNVSHERARRKETQKYLRESCYHHTKCTTATFLAAFMWRRPLNNTTSANATHRKPKRVSNGTGTQVRAQMINKCRIKKEGYITWKTPHGRGGKKTVNKSVIEL